MIDIYLFCAFFVSDCHSITNQLNSILIDHGETTEYKQGVFHSAN